MICLAVTYVVLPNRVEDAIDLFTRMTEESQKEPGCRMYQVHRSQQEPRRFFLYEQYDDEKALEAHRASSHFEQYVQRGLFRIIESRTPDTWIPLQLHGRRG
ncbi:MAG TPA: putative quinol monooxygenase [Myxococcaceae bacterium]|nr:putative quinol monooxygenase [Myxococcaceae bacterium]